jgi:hypothetical protein
MAITDFDQQQADLRERRKRAREGQQFNAIPGQMVSGHYVAPHWTQVLAEGLRGYNAIQGEKQADQELKDLTGKRQTAMTDALRGFSTNMAGAPEQRTPMQADYFDEADRASLGGNQNLTAVTPERKADPRAAYASLLASPDAAMRTAGMTGMARIPEMEARQQELQETRQARIDAAAQAHQDRMAVLEANNASAATRQKEQQDFLREMKRMSGGGASSQPYFQPVQTGQGVMAFNARTGRVEPVMGPDGSPVVGAQFDPALQGTLAATKAGATTTAKSEAEATLEAPKVVAEADEAVRLVDDLLKAPGFKQAVGASRMLGVQKIPGTAARDFDIRLEQLQGKQFLQAFESLKGGGQITEIEGKKATDAIARMNASGSEAEFIKAAREFQDVIRTGADRARKRLPATNNATPQRTVTRTGTVNGRKVVQYSDGTTEYAD